MKKIIALTLCVLFLLLLGFAPSPSTNIRIAKASEASVIWGINAEMTCWEEDATEYTCAVIYDWFDDNGVYEHLENYYGDDTEQQNFYDEVHDCEEYYDYATVFYKGHSNIPSYCEAGEGPYGYHYHQILIDNDGWDNPPYTDDQIWDNVIHQQLSGLTHGLVFLWSCWTDEMGELVNADHSWGFPASFFNRSDLSTNAWPYYESDDSGCTYLGFEETSIDFVCETDYGDPPGYNYGDFCRYFYDYATRSGGYTIRLSLYYASYDTIGCSYSLSPLYQGYSFWKEGEEYEGRQVFYGDGHEDLPD
jgi:hypothetical protein